MLRKLVALLAFWCVLGPAMAAPLPEALVGVWATDGAVLRGQALFEGEGLYLGPDGVGAIVGGPPAIGIKVIASFDRATATIHLDILEKGKVVGQGAAVYDESTKSISFGDPTHPLLHRRFEDVRPETLKALGL